MSLNSLIAFVAMAAPGAPVAENPLTMLASWKTVAAPAAFEIREDVKKARQEVGARIENGIKQLAKDPEMKFTFEDKDGSTLWYGTASGAKDSLFVKGQKLCFDYGSKDHVQITVDTLKANPVSETMTDAQALVKGWIKGKNWLPLYTVKADDTLDKRYEFTKEATLKVHVPKEMLLANLRKPTVYSFAR